MVFGILLRIGGIILPANERNKEFSEIKKTGYIFSYERHGMFKDFPFSQYLTLDNSRYKDLVA